MSLFAGEGYKITGNAGVMYFVATDAPQRDSEDVYRSAVAEACAGKRICQVQFWIGMQTTPAEHSTIRTKYPSTLKCP